METYAEKNDIYSWFETGDFPTEAQFRATWDSYWHKSEKIAMANINGLLDALSKTVSVTTFNNHLTDANAHSGYLARKDGLNLNAGDVLNWRNQLGLNNIGDMTNYYTKAEVNGLMYSVYRAKGSVNNYAALPSSGNVFGDVYNLIDSGDNYVWVDNLNNSGIAGWDKLSGAGVVDLSNYHTITQYQKWVNDQGFASASALSAKQDSANRVSTWSATTSNNNYPSEKLVKDSLDAVTTQQIKTIYANITLDDTYHNCIVRIMSNCTITVPEGLRTDFNATFDTNGAVIGTFVEGANIIFSAPFGKILRDNAMCTLYKTASKNFRLNGGLIPA